MTKMVAAISRRSAGMSLGRFMEAVLHSLAARRYKKERWRQFIFSLAAAGT